jgi:hypothetical protein
MSTYGDFNQPSLPVKPIVRRKRCVKLHHHAKSLTSSSKKLLLLSSALVFLFAPTTLAQLSSPPDVAQFVYKRVPTLALENQYVRSENNKQAPESTLVSRMVQYHSIKGRSPLYRLDWKITLADYLGINEVIQPETFPGYAFLKKNPLDSDRAAVQKLNASQRNALVQALVDAFGGSRAAETIKPSAPSVPQTKSAPQAKPKSTPAYRPTLNPLPAPGSANSLKTSPVGSPSTPGGGDAQFLK